jgi:hypothetical protein
VARERHPRVRIDAGADQMFHSTPAESCAMRPAKPSSTHKLFQSLRKSPTRGHADEIQTE